MFQKSGKRIKTKDEEEFLPKALQKDKKEQKIKNTKNKSFKKKLKKFFLFILLIVFITICFILGISSHCWKTLAKQMLINQNSIVIDSDGEKIASLGCEKKFEQISLSEIPNDLKNAYVSIEDQRYYSHHGVDIKRTGAAIASYIFHFGKSSYGGSTITQQLVKNLTGDSTDNISRKVKEWWKSWQLETCLSKDEILSCYLNIIYVGPNMYGVETASKYYFNKSCKDLSLEQCAFLAGINHSPNSYNPFGEKDNLDKIAKRTKIVLSKMLELNYINKDSYNIAINNLDKGLNFKKGEIKSEDAVYSYHTDALILQITEDIAKKYNISQTFATNFINMAGLTIHSTQNSNIQEKTELEFAKSKYSISSKNSSNSSQAAMVIIDHKNGYVVGCTGGLGKKTEARSLNRATQSIRQTGSSIKPLSVLIPAIDRKIITAASIYDDTEKDFADGYHPTDYNNPLGNITVRRAVESSQNIPFVEIMQELKPKVSINYLKRIGITTLTKEDETLVLSLGGLQKGISPLQMAAAYAMIANNGEYIEPTFYSSIDNNSGNNLLNSKQKKQRVVSKDVAYIVKEILTQPVNGTYGTATYCKISGVDVSAKTGTTDENYDRWLCGFTPYYSAVTWYGFDQNESIEYNKKNPAGLLWANVMSRIHTGLNSQKFDKPSSVNSCTICSETGKRANTGCPNTYTEYFLMFTSPDSCDKHSGSELKDNIINTTQNQITNIIQDITHDIDVVDPQQVPPKDNTINNINTTNSSNTKPNNIVTNNTHNNTSNTNNTYSNTITNNNLTNSTYNNSVNTNSNISNENNNSSNTANNSTNTQNSYKNAIAANDVS